MKHSMSHMLQKAKGLWSLMYLLCLFAPQTGWALTPVSPDDAINHVVSPDDAINHVGSTNTICGTVASANYVTTSKGKPTFLNLDYPYPRQVFTAIVWGRDRDKFPYRPEALEGRQICVHGEIKKYKGKAEIIVTKPSQIVPQ